VLGAVREEREEREEGKGRRRGIRKNEMSQKTFGFYRKLAFMRFLQSS
jgi:hypothetical protein